MTTRKTPQVMGIINVNEESFFSGSRFTAADEISRLLSVPKEEISDGVSKLNDTLTKERADFKSYRLSSAKTRAAAVEHTSGNLVLHFDKQKLTAY